MSSAKALAEHSEWLAGLSVRDASDWCLVVWVEQSTALVEMHKLDKIRKKRSRNIVGLMSGTSIDGVDAALVKVEGCGSATSVELLGFEAYSYPTGLKDEILSISLPGKGSVDRICTLNVVLGEIFAKAALAVISKCQLTVDNLDLIGSHGQTVHHLPQAKDKYGLPARSTLQLGEPSVIAKRTGVITVADFRPADMALGGQGAPLVPYFDAILYARDDRIVGMLNIGGIANMTVLHGKERIDEVDAFDTGPGNMVIDALMQRLYGKPFDEKGQVAGSGKVNNELLDFALQHPYFGRQPPKSTGREEFGEPFVRRCVEYGTKLGLSSEDMVATATELTVRSIWQSYERFVAPKSVLDELVVSGGGVENTIMMQSLTKHFDGIAVRPIDDYGIPPEAKEAICFAVLANETVCGNPNNVPSATGASKPTILGKICL